jgi:hypothetical protein
LPQLSLRFLQPNRDTATPINNNPRLHRTERNAFHLTVTAYAAIKGSLIEPINPQV